MSRYNIYYEQVTSHSIQSFIETTGAVAVSALRICLGCRSKSKNREKQLTFIVRVSGRVRFSGQDIKLFYPKTIFSSKHVGKVWKVLTVNIGCVLVCVFCDIAWQQKGWCLTS